MTPIHVLFICHGNICRSPMAEFVLKSLVEKTHLEDWFEIESAATSTEEIWNGRGNPIYPPAVEEMNKHGIGRSAYTDFSRKRAKQITRSDYAKYDYILCADANNIRNTLRIVGEDPEKKVKLLLSYVKGREQDSISDPWYTGDFETTYQDVLEGCTGFLKFLMDKGEVPSIEQ